MSEISMITEYITALIESIGTFLSSGIMFYLMATIIFAMIIKVFISIVK